MNEETRRNFNPQIISRYRDEIYGISILWIMLFHSYLCNVKAEKWVGIPGFCWVGRYLGYGNMGCELFLLLSGIGLYYSFSKNPDVVQFYKKRLKRLVLPAFLICGPYWIWQFVMHKITFLQLIEDFSLMRLWIDGNQQIWFVSFIFVGYLIYPVLHKLIYFNRKYAEIVTLLLIGTSIAVIWLCRTYLPVYYDGVEIAINRMPIFILGCYLGHLVMEGKPGPGLIWVLFGLCFIIGFDLLNRKALLPIWERLFYLIPGVSVTFLAAGVIGLYPEKHITKGLRWFGHISLECYLVHIIFIRLYKGGQFFYRYIPGSRGRYLGVIAAAVFVAYIASLAEQLILRWISGETKNGQR